MGASIVANAFRVDLRDHLIFPGLINAHEHLHINAQRIHMLHTQCDVVQLAGLLRRCHLPTRAL